MLSDLKFRLRAIFRRAEMERDLAAELELHREREVAKLTARGLTPGQAQRQARLALGGAEQVKEAARDTWGVRAIESMMRDLRHAFRVLRKHPAVTASGIVILSISTGASTAVFTVLDSTVFKPLPVANAERLVRLTVVPDATGGGRRYPPYAAFERLRGLTHGLEQLAAESRPTMPAAAAAQRAAPAGPPGVRAMCATGNFFDVLGVHARVGRTLQPFDESPGAYHDVAVGTYTFWRDRFQLEPTAIGSTVLVRSRPFTLVGFLPDGFKGIRKGAAFDVYVPTAAMTDACLGTWGGSSTVEAIGLLARDTSQPAASAELAQLWNVLKESGDYSPGTISGQLAISNASRGIAAVNDNQETSLYLLAWAVALIVLLGCLNASCLLAVQGVARRNEIALRRALGATASAVLRQTMLESCLLTAAGGAGGLALAMLGGQAILAWLGQGVRPVELAVDARVLGFSLAVVLISGLVSGVIPALDALRTRHLQIHRDEQLRPFRSGKVLIGVEVALSLTLLAGAVMFLRGVGNLRSVPLGFDARDVAVITLWPNFDNLLANSDQEGYVTSEASRLRDRLLHVPGFEQATVGTGRTFTGGLRGETVRRAGVTSDESVAIDAVQRVDDRYFDVLQIPLVAGRGFSTRDDDGSERVVILSHSLAKRLFGQANPLGQSVSVGATTASVVGVAGDIQSRSVKVPPASMIYLPLWQRLAGRGWVDQTNVQVRTRQSPAQVSAAIEGEISAGHSALQPSPFADPTTLEAMIGASYADDTLRLNAMSLLASIALVLVVVGLYGVMAYAVARRVREIGLRMAIGATPKRIAILVVKECATVVGIGILAGIPGAVVVMRAIASYTFEVSPIDPATLGGAIVGMLLAAGVAVARPIWRSTHVDPVEALRAH
ncbi:MAG TPA: ABC transporter permease [Vicinamibacterales bacterium]|nr:ABC transporter permease [Vicinamibacterales bacterium]